MCALPRTGARPNARSPVALMALGVARGEPIEIRATGPDAAAAVGALTQVLLVPAAGAPDAAAAATATPARPTPAVADGPGTSAAARRPAANAAAAPLPDGTLIGVVASAGFALGTALQLQRPEIAVTETGGGVSQESEALDRARAAVRARLERRAGAAGEGARGEGAAEAARAIAAAHLELLDDPELLAAARGAIAQGKSAAFAWRAAVRASAATLAALTDARLRERVDDLLDLESQVLLALAGSAAGAAPPLPAHAIVIARELLPSQLAALDAARVAGICMAAGGPTSHVSILAAAMGIPALVALGPGVLGVRDGTALLLDAGHGVLEIDPPAARLAAARAEVAARGAQRAALEAAAQRECRTADGTRIEVLRQHRLARRGAGRGAQRRGGLRAAAYRVPVSRSPARRPPRPSRAPNTSGSRRSWGSGPSPSARSMPAATSRSLTCRCRQRTTRRSGCAGYAPASPTRSCCARSCARCSRFARPTAGCCCR